MEREILLDNLIGRSKIESIKAGIQPSEGGVIKSAPSSQMETWLDQRFGRFGVKVLGVSDGAEKLRFQDVTVMGGWCAIRTADLMQLQQGIVVNPKSGVYEGYKDVGKVADWIQRAVSIDQIVEAIGLYNGSDFVAISEEKLWGERVKAAVEGSLHRLLTTQEEVQIAEAMQRAEERRYQTTKRYLSYTTERDIDLRRVVDTDIYGDLVQVRDNMLDTAGISLDELISQYSEEKTTKGYSIVWGMYTGPYLALLKSKGYVQTPKGLIVEPWMHAVSETRAKKLVNQRIFGTSRNSYLTEGGVNQDLGFVAYADVMLPNGQRLRKSAPINAVPNQENYQEFIDQLRDDPTCSSLTLSDNPAFVWGTNLLPFGRTKDILRQMVSIKEIYKQEKRARSKIAQTREEASRQALMVKEEYGSIMQQLAQQVITDLEGMLRFVFKKDL